MAKDTPECQHKLKVLALAFLTHWGRVTHICVGNLAIIVSDSGLSPGRRQAIIWTNAGILLIRPLGTNFSEILIKIHTLSFKKTDLKISSGKWRPCCLGLNVLTHRGRVTHICPSKLTIISSDNGLPPARRQAIIWTNDGIWLNGPIWWEQTSVKSFIESFIFSFKIMHLKMPSWKWLPFCLDLNVIGP